MSNNGPFVMILILTVVVLGMVGAALTMGRPAAAGSGTARAGGPGVSFQVTFARTAQGVAATVLATNQGTEDLREVTITRAGIASMTGSSPLPIVLPKLPRGATTTMALPFSGAAPSANAPLSLEIDYTYRFGSFGNGSGSRGITSTVP